MRIKILIAIFALVGFSIAPKVLADSSVTNDWSKGVPAATGNPSIGEYFDWSNGQPVVVEKFVATPVVTTNQIWVIEID